ncbi:signal peptidase II [Lactobacillus sp. S2-2]|uniref:signal peptidase II n=1 Tax=Lactobacillus sp. S2-2 TaxID=2692917 RepID=UPI001F01954E|nr:signal peptidase II [Lactobacillus sp. S2-2]MCF6515060.1 signal peptidase II [Lactobacillus sp. S2-2]
MEKLKDYSKNKRILFSSILIILLILLDQLSKYWINKNIKINESINIVDNLFSITNIRNYGAAWSILQGQTIFLFLTSIVALFIFIYFLIKKINKLPYLIALTLAISGTIGNFIDRIRFGFVTDMIQLDFINFPIFNFADSCMVIGMIILVYAILKDDEINE